VASQQDLLSAVETHRLGSAKQFAELIETTTPVALRWLSLGVQRRLYRKMSGLPSGGRPELWFYRSDHERSHAQHDWNVTRVAVEIVRTCRRLKISAEFRRVSFPSLTPDLAVFLDNGKMTVPLFIEVDCDTEPHRRSGAGTSLFAKFMRYVEIRAANTYLTLQPIGSPLGNGFRVLVIATESRRCKQIVQQLHDTPGRFIWATSVDRLCGEGAHAAVWNDGKQETPRSILHREASS
jgi:hypothetical protein